MTQEVVLLSAANVIAGLTFAWYLSGRITKLEVLVERLNETLERFEQCHDKCIGYEYRLKMLERKSIQHVTSVAE